MQSQTRQLIACLTAYDWVAGEVCSQRSRPTPVFPQAQAATDPQIRQRVHQPQVAADPVLPARPRRTVGAPLQVLLSQADDLVIVVERPSRADARSN